MKIKIIAILLLLSTIVLATDEYDSQVSTPISKYNVKISDFKRYLHQRDVQPIYIYINKAVVRSASKGKVLPLYISTVVQSILKEFGDKVKVILSHKRYQELKNDSNCFAIQGAITAYDDGIKVDTTSLNLFINLTINDKKNKDKGKYKIKNKISQMIGDFMIVKDGIVRDKVSSKIIIRGKSSGYRFGINMFGSTLGVSHYEHIEDGIEASMRKLVEASMIDLMGKVFGIQTYHTMPEIQAKKNPVKDSHLSNRDFCSNINKIVLYPLALKDESFDQFGMSYQSEINKLKCLKDLYDEGKEKKYKIRLNTVYGELTDRTQSYENVRFIQKQIISLSDIKRQNTLTDSKQNRKICDKPENIEYCKFVENRVELEKVLK